MRFAGAFLMRQKVSHLIWPGMPLGETECRFLRPVAQNPSTWYHVQADYP